MSDTRPWTEKYRPGTVKEFRGSSKTVEKVLNWVKNWDNQKTDALLLHGEPGIGKTTLVGLVAEELGLEIFETNASDVRTKKALQSSLEQAVQQRSLTGRKKLILIDEVDGMSSRDRGGKSQISKIINKTKFPIIMTANDAYANGMQSIRRKSNVVQLKKVHTNSVNSRLKEIAEKEGLEYEKSAVKSIARRAGGDMRAALNDLQSLAEKHGEVTSDLVKELGYRDTEKDVFQALKLIFKTTNISTAKNAVDGVDENYDTLFEWIRENIPKEYKKKNDLAEAMDVMSKADVFKGRMVTRQNWSLLKYVYVLMSAGVSVSKEEKYRGFTRYSYPSKIKKMGRSKASRKKRKDISLKVGKKLHTSVSTATDLIPFLSILMEKEDWKENIVEHLDLTEDEIKFIKNF